MTIVKNVKRDGKRVTLTLLTDGSVEILRLTAAAWDGTGLVKGDAVAPEAAAELRRTAALSAAVTDAVRLAADSPHSVSALREKLRRRGHSKEDAARAVAAVAASGALNEEENARHVARSIFERTKRGKTRIYADLLAKGYPAAAARDAADSVTDEEYVAALKYHLEKKTGGATPDAEQRRRAVAALARLGFPPSKTEELLK